MIYEGLLYGVGFVLAFVVLYGLSWVVLGAVWLCVGDDSPVVAFVRHMRARWRHRNDRAILHRGALITGRCERCGQSFPDVRPWPFHCDLYELTCSDGSRAHVLSVPRGVRVRPCGERNAARS